MRWTGGRPRAGRLTVAIEQRALNPFSADFGRLLPQSRGAWAPSGGIFRGESMIELARLSTDRLDPRRRLELWNDSASSSFAPMVCDPLTPQPFNAGFVRGRLGEISLTEVHSDPVIVRHLRSHVAHCNQALFFLHVELEGQCVARQSGREALLQPGDFTLCDTEAPYELVSSGAKRMLVLGIPDRVMRRYVACPESVVAVRMPGASGMSALASEFLRSLWHRCREGLEPEMATRALNAALDLVAGAYSEFSRSHPSRSSIAAAHRARIVNYIEAHLGDPDLTPKRIGEACKLTTRYLHHLFSDGEETVARYILRRRLDECAKALALPSLRGRTVTSIAFDYGFNSPTHFGRAFRARFGMTPREYRQRRMHARLDSEEYHALFESADQSALVPQGVAIPRRQRSPSGNP
ncbi:MAG: hypothetical protein DIU71_18810 [Proteobacteria bacterium]|nr:MAG: hypothetical protein DIU71_18810 [Pseudomonadota bacterium]